MPFHFLHKAVLGKRELKEVLKEAQTIFAAYVWGADNLESDLTANVEDWHEVGDIGEPAFENSWVNAGGSEATAAFYKDPWGLVHIKGRIASGTLGTAFTLPAGYRPALVLDFSSVANNAFAKIQILADGSVITAVGSTTWFSINCSFKSE